MIILNPIHLSSYADLRRRSLVFLLLLMQEGLYEVGVTTNTRLDFSLLVCFDLKKEVEIGISPSIGTLVVIFTLHLTIKATDYQRMSVRNSGNGLDRRLTNTRIKIA